MPLFSQTVVMMGLVEVEVEDEELRPSTAVTLLCEATSLRVTARSGFALGQLPTRTLQKPAIPLTPLYHLYYRNYHSYLDFGPF